MLYVQALLGGAAEARDTLMVVLREADPSYAAEAEAAGAARAAAAAAAQAQQQQDDVHMHHGHMCPDCGHYHDEE